MNIQFETVSETHVPESKWAMLGIKYTLVGLLPMSEEDVVFSGGVPRIETLRRIRDRLSILCDIWEFPDDPDKARAELSSGGTPIFRVRGDNSAISPGQSPEGTEPIQRNPSDPEGPNFPPSRQIT